MTQEQIEALKITIPAAPILAVMRILASIVDSGTLWDEEYGQYIDLEAGELHGCEVLLDTATKHMDTFNTILFPPKGG